MREGDTGKKLGASRRVIVISPGYKLQSLIETLGNYPSCLTVPIIWFVTQASAGDQADNSRPFGIGEVSYAEIIQQAAKCHRKKRLDERHRGHKREHVVH